MTLQQKVQGRLIGVVGMARSGMAAARLAMQHGARLFVSDAAPMEKVSDQAAELTAASIPYECGGHTERLLECDYLVLSPGVPLDVPILQSAREKGIPLFSELEFASWFCEGQIVAVTGSNGKTTTTTLIGEILKADGHDVNVCGNIGRPFSEVVQYMAKESIAVVEVSTFQLETIESFRPKVAVILNLTPDHLDRHGSFDIYRKLKHRITENQVAGDYLILNRDDPETMAEVPQSAAGRLFFSLSHTEGVASYVEDDALHVLLGHESTGIIDCRDILMPGRHNLQNAAAATLAASLFDVHASIISRVLESFPGVEHRLESLGRVAGVKFYNDSKATNVSSVCVALEAVEEPVYLICGGRDKGSSYDPIAEAGRNKIKGLIVIGEAREKIVAALGKAFEVQLAATLEEAVEAAFEAARPGDAVLLSPGCASFDMFENFEERGHVFKAAVQALTRNSNTNETVSN
ncbi:MAG: UDP-N-acetylmuramoyl-L-alanine--D-glutamate ligase [Candidatus Zixiibacteriota bacterium]|nr:MAG: UDP-N-acetylmuramoyl-L-alanine--D-glutamate ligase [candidate division Zixibacteria bacterium]